MELMEAVVARHSVRKYADQKIEGETLAQLRACVEECNRESGLHIQLCINEPTAFDSMMARYGKLENVRNYIALVGKKGKDLQAKCGYYGEKVALHAQQLGLNTCWVAATFSKRKSRQAITIAPGEKLLMVIALGYGQTQGTPHLAKPLEQFYEASGEVPDWFLRGMEAAMLAPTAMHQQKFRFTLSGNTVALEPGSGVYTETDAGIVKYHFEIGAAGADWTWAK